MEKKKGATFSICSTDKMKRRKLPSNNVLAMAFILIFLSIFIKIIVETVDLTGIAIVQYGTVSVNITSNIPAPANVSNIIETGLMGGDRSIQVPAGIRIEPRDIIRAFSHVFYVGAEEQRQFFLKNTADFTQVFSITSNLPNVRVVPSSIKLGPQQEVAISYYISKLRPGAFAGKIRIQSDYLTYEIPIAITIKQRDNLFGVNLDVPDATVAPGETLYFKITLSRVNGGMTDLKYILLDATNKQIIRITERKKADKSFTLQKEMKIPTSIKPGSYLLAAEVTYNGKIDVDSQVVRIQGKNVPRVERPQATTKLSINPWAILILMIILLAIIFDIFYLRRRKNPRL